MEARQARQSRLIDPSKGRASTYRQASHAPSAHLQTRICAVLVACVCDDVGPACTARGEGTLQIGQSNQRMTVSVDSSMQ
jgi:hypothetical protein